MKLKKLLSLLLAVTMLFSCVGITAMAEDAEDVFPNGMSASNYEELFGDNTVTDGESYWKTLEEATKAICGTENAVLYCKPDADVGKMTHGPVTATLTVYGNGAYTSGNGDFDIGNGDPNGGKEVTADMTLTVKNLNGCGAWGTKATDHTVNLVFENCKDMSEVYLSGTPGILNISITDCEFTDNVDGGNCKVYSNANGEITLTNVLFSRVDKAVNLNHKVAGTQTVTINNCTFTNCGKNVDAGTDEIPVRILSSVEGGKSVATITNCSFSGTPEGGADILIDYGVGTTTATISGTAANVSEEKENNVPEKKTVTETETYVASNVEVEADAVAEINGTPYATLADALVAAKSMTGDVVVKIYDKVTLSQPFSGSYDSIKFVGKEKDAEIYLDFQGYIDATGENVVFEDLKLSKVAGGFVDNAGFMNLAFGINSATSVTYTNCTFLNGAYASKGTNTFKNCTFYRSHDRYGLWAYGAETIVVEGCKFADIRGIKLWAEGNLETTDLTVKNTDFSAATDKPAIVLASGKSVTLEKNTYSSKGVFELDLKGVPNGTKVTSDKPEEITCINDNGVCGVLVDGKIYTTVAQAAEVATEGSKVTLLHNSAETVEFDEGVILDKNDFTAAGVTVKEPAAVAEINGTPYATLADAISVANAGDTIVLLSDTTESIAAIENVKLTTNVAGGVVFTNTYADYVDFNGVTVGSGVTLNIPYVYSNGASSVNVIEGTLNVGTTYYHSGDAKTTIHNGGKVITGGMTVVRYNNSPDAGIYIYGDGDNSTVEFSCGDTIGAYSGTFYAEDAVVNGNMMWLDYKKGSTEEHDKYPAINAEFKNSIVNVTQEFRLYKDAGLTLAGSQVTAGKVQVRENATPAVNIENSTIKADAVENLSGATIEAVLGEDGTVSFKTYVATIGSVKYTSLAAAVAAVQEGETINILPGTISEGTIKLPATLKNVTFKGAENNASVLKDMTIMAFDGSSINYEGLTFDTIAFDNSRISITGWRNTGATVKDFTVTKCQFKNLNDTTNSAPLHFNMAATEAVYNFTFTDNVIDGATGGSKSGVYAQVTGEVVFANNVINNTSFRPYVIQVTSDDGVADNFVVTGNTFSGTAAGRAQGLSNNAEGTDTVNLVVSGNIFKDITASQQICYWNFNPATTTTDISKNYYDIDIAANPSGIYCNGEAACVEDLVEMGVYPIYTELNSDGTINLDSLADAPVAEIIAEVNGTSYSNLSDAITALKANGGTLKLLADIYESITLNYPAEGAETELVIDLNGFKVTSAESTLWVSDGYNVTVKDSSAEKTGKIITTSSGDEAIAIARGGKVTLENGSVEGVGYGVYLYGKNATGEERFVVNGGSVVVPNGGTAIAIGSGKVTVNGGKVICNKTPGGAGWLMYVFANGALEITGGEFKATIGNYGSTAISGGTFSYCDDPNDGFNNEHLAAGYGVKKNSDGTFTVYKLPEGLSGSGTEEDPYLITSLDELKWFRNSVNTYTQDRSNQYINKYVKLTVDIDLDEDGDGVGEAWEPIGQNSKDDHTAFLGIFDGDGHTISNVYVNSKKQNAGFFARTGSYIETEKSEIKNITFNNVYVHSDSSHVGGVVGNSDARTFIENVHVTGTIDVKANGGYVGGIVGHGYPVIKNSTVVAEGVIDTAFWCAGGMVGYAGEGSTNIMNSKVEGVGENALAIKSAAGAVGAFVGWAEDNKGTQPISGSNLTAKNVKIQTYTGAYGDSYSDNALGYLYGGSEITKFAGTNIIENITFLTSTGETNPPAVDAVAKIGNNVYVTLENAIAAANAGDTVKVIADIENVAVDVNKNITITGNVTANNVSINAVEGCSELTVENISFTGNSWINSGAANKLTVSGVTADVTPSNQSATNSRSAFVSLGRSEQHNLELVVENCNIVSKGGSDPILGWASITKATLKNNTFGSATAYQENSDSVKFMSIADGAVFDITGNTVYSNYNGIVFAQNTTRNNAYTVNIDGNTFLGGADHIWIEITGGNTVNATILATSNNTVNGNKFTKDDIKAHTGVIKNWTSFAGVDVVTNADGKVIGGSIAFYAADAIAEGYKVDETGLVVEDITYVAEVNGVQYATLEEALKNLTSGAALTLLEDITIDFYWDARNTGAKITVPVTIDGNGKTIKFTNTVYDGGNYMSAFRFEADATVKNLTIDMSEALSGFAGRFRAISAKANLAVDNCTFIGNGSENNTRAIIYGEGAESAIGEVEVSITNSKFEGWRRGVSDNENAQDAKTVKIEGNTFKEADVYVSAKTSITFNNNVMDESWANLRAYKEPYELSIVAQGNTLEENGAKANEIKNFATKDVQAGFAFPVAQVNGTSYATLTDAFNAVADGGEIVILASVAVEEETTLAKSVTISGEALNANGKLTIADGVTLNSANLTGTYYAAAGATVTVNTPQATLYAGGNLTFVGANVLSSFSAGYYNRVITIDAGNSLKVTSGRLTVSYGNTFNIKGNITDAKTTDKTGVIPSLELVGGISLNGDGGNVSFNIDNAYVKLGDSTSKNSGATGEFNINFTNSIVDFTKTLKTYNPTVDGLNPGFNLNWKDSIVSIYSHLELWRSSTNLTLDNTELIVGGSFANAGKVDVTKKSNFVVKEPIMSSHGGNTGTITIDGAKMEFVDSNEDWQNNGTIKITADGKLITNDFAFNNAIIVDAAKLEAGTSATVIEYHDDAPEGKIILENGDNVDVKCENGSVIIEKKQLPVAQIGETPYASLEDAIAAANEGDTVKLLADIEQVDGVLINDKNIEIDLNSYTYKVTKGDNTNSRAILVKGSSEVTIKNGTIIAAGDINSGTYGTVRTEGTSNVALTGLKLYSYRGAGLNVKVCPGTTVTVSDTEIYAQYGGGIEANGGTVILNEGVKIEQSGIYDGYDWCSVAIGVNYSGKVVVNSGSYSAAPISTDSNAAKGSWVAYVMNSGGTLEINGGTFNGIISETAVAANACGIICADTSAVVNIKGGKFISNGAILDVRNNTGGVNPSVTLEGGTYSADPADSGLYGDNLIKYAEGYVAIKNLDGSYVVGAKPSATVNNLGMQTVPANEYTIWNGSFIEGTEPMPLSFVMQFIADQTAADMATSPYADWYADFVLTFEGLEDDSFKANGCYLAGYYGSFGWVKVPVDGMTIEEGARYPVMLGVGLGQTYDYVCSGVQDFKCALYVTPEILAANPNLKVNLELAVVDSSKGGDAATEALVKNENTYKVTDYNYEAKDFVVKELFDIYASTVNLGNSLAMKFAIQKTDIEDVDYYAEIKHDTDAGEKVIQIPFESWVDDGDYYIVTYSGIFAKQIGDDINITIKKNGTPVSNTRADGLKKYALKKMERLYNKGSLSEAEKESMTVLADMLNYGAAAQKRFEYKTDKLATDGVDEKYLAYATQETPELTDISKKDESKYYGATLSLKENIVYKAAFIGVTDGMKAVVSFTKHSEEVPTEKTIEYKDMEHDNEYSIVKVDNLVIADANQIITITIYNSDGTEYTVLKDSMNSYFKRGTEHSSRILEMAAKFTASAYNTLH